MKIRIVFAFCPEAVQAMTAYRLLKKQGDELKKQTEAVKQHIMELMGNTEEAKIDGTKVTWKMTAGRVTLDSKALKKDMPSVYEKYKKVGKETRTFRIW